MEVIVAEKCGFCHGVENAIRMAEKRLAENGSCIASALLSTTRMSSSSWRRSGLKTVDSVEEIHSGTVLIRSHGAAPKEIEKLKAKGINIVDATCVLVKRCRK